MSSRTSRFISLVAAAWCVVSTAAADESLQLRLEPRLNEAFPKKTEGRPVYGSGMHLDGRTEREMSLLGEAEIRRADTVVRGDRLAYYPDDDELVAVGNVRVVRAGTVFVGPELRLRLDANEGSFESPSYFMPAYRGRGRADRIDFLGHDRAELVGGTYSTCRPEDPDWYLKADRILIDQTREEGEGRKASLYFKDSKILSAPAFGFPLGDERRSGFLAPSFAMTTRTGIDFGVPYYWNLAPNRDFTFYPRLMTRSGVQVGGLYRFLEPNTMGQVRFEYTPQDVTTHTDRYFWGVQDRFNDVLGWSGSINARGVSDDNYFVDYARSIVTSAERSLPRDITAMRSWRDWTFLVRASQYQNILEARAAPPYERVPQLNATHVLRDAQGFDTETLLDATYFKQPIPNSPLGTRLVANPRVSFPVMRPGWFVVPKVGVHASQYQLSSNGQYESSLTRAVPMLSLDSGLVFERPARYLGREVTQTLEPRVFYAYTPYRDQSAFPVFDTAVADINFAQLFSENTFIGNDRIADVNQMTLAAVSRIIEPATGAESLRFALGERHYFTQQRVQIANVKPLMDQTSDILMAASANLGGGATLDGGIQYAASSSKVPRLNLLYRYLPTDGRIFNVGVRHMTDTIGQIDTSWRWPLARNWNTIGRVNYSWLNRTIDPVTQAVVPTKPGVIENVLGFEYNESCWTGRALVHYFVSAAGTTTTAFFLQLQLNGLGSIGSNPFDILRRNIPGYRLFNDRPERPSGFFGYE